jgi:predicted glutamine amidotransferase
MCRLFAIVAEHPKTTELPELMVPFRAQSRYHPDGWGIGWYFNGGVQVEKAPTPAYKDPRFMTTCMSADSNIILAHIRKLSIGTPSPENTHPFSYGRYLFEHNGTVHTKGELVDLLPPDYRGRIQGQTDSEQLFYWILYHIDGRGNAVEGIREAVRYIKEHLGEETTSFNFIMSDGEKVYAYRSARRKPNYYSMMYCEREPSDDYPGRSVVISSRKLNRRKWCEVDNDQMLVVDKLLNISKLSF